MPALCVKIKILKIRVKMKKFFSELVQRFTSRKFLLTLAAGLTLAANQQWTELVILITGYTGFEGTKDIVGRYTEGNVKAAELEQKTQLIQSGDLAVETVDKGNIVPGGEETPNLQ